MTNSDLAEEWRNLQKTYAAMAPGELAAVASEGYELTETARQALRAEIATRGLEITLREVGPPDEVAFLDLVRLEHVWKLEEARRLTGVLEAAGIHAYWGHDHLQDADALGPSFDSGVDMEVKFADYQSAQAALAASPSPLEDAVSEADVVARCPSCHCPDIVFENLEDAQGTDRDAGQAFNWTCAECGHHWQDDGVEGT